MHAQTLAAGLPVLAGFVSLAIQMNRMRSAPCQDLGGQRWPQRRERLRPSSCPALGWACALGLGEGVSVLCGLAPHKACPRQPEPLLGTSKGAGAILSKPQGQSSNNELDPLKSQLSWKSSLPFLWSGAWPRSLCPLDRLGPWEGPASQSVWPGLKVCGGQQPAPSLERGPGAAAADDIGKAGLCFLPSPHRGARPWQLVDGAPGSDGGSAPPRVWPGLTPSQASRPVGCSPSRSFLAAPCTFEVEASPAGASLAVSGSQPWRETIIEDRSQFKSTGVPLAPALGGWAWATLGGE